MATKDVAPKKFPPFVHIKRENEGTEDEYLDATEGTAEQALDSRDKTRVAAYKLVEVKEGRLEPVFNTVVG